MSINSKAQTIYFCGFNNNGHLAPKDTGNHNEALLASTIDNFFENFKVGEIIDKFIISYNHILIFTNFKRVLGFGSNGFGQLGFLQTSNKFTIPVEIPYPNDNIKEEENKIKEILNVKCGVNHSVFLVKTFENKRRVYSCGLNRKGQAGVGLENTVYVMGLNLVHSIKENIEKITCGYFSTFYFVLDDENNNDRYLENNRRYKVYAAGNNNNYQIGIYDENDGNEYVFTPKLVNTDNFKLNEFILKIESSVDHCFFITNLNNVYGCGYNNYGQLGLIESESKLMKPTLLTQFKDYKQIKCGWYFTLFLNQNNELFGCGNNSDSQLTFPSQEKSKIYTLTKINLPFQVDTIFTGATFCLFKSIEGNYYGCGENSCYQLGIDEKGIIDKPRRIIEKNITSFRYKLFIGNHSKVTIFMEIKKRGLQWFLSNMKQMSFGEKSIHFSDILIL
ncbi:hypothetical protein ABK040_008455 [Willaertia magna]